jgi:hypothetical protein
MKVYKKEVLKKLFKLEGGVGIRHKMRVKAQERKKLREKKEISLVIQLEQRSAEKIAKNQEQEFDGPVICIKREECEWEENEVDEVKSGGRLVGYEKYKKGVEAGREGKREKRILKLVRWQQ